MKVVSVRAFINSDKKWHTAADIEVEGLGKVTIEHCFSDGLIAQMEAEALTALQMKFGQIIKVNKVIEV